MIRGWTHEGRPWIRGLVFIPRLNLEGPVIFLVDTGSDTSTIHPYNGREIGIDYDRDFAGRQMGASTGVGGSGSEYVEVCEVQLLQDDGSVDLLVLPIGFADAGQRGVSFAPWLDVMRGYRLTFEELRGLVQLDSPVP